MDSKVQKASKNVENISNVVSDGLTWDDIYFKDAFTQNEDNLNLEVNNATVDSLVSSNNSFSLDQNGNLIVNSITANSGGGILTRQQICDFIYPVGSVYLSVNSTSPATLFGGSWTRIKDRVLLSVGDIYTTSKQTGGSNVTKGHTLTIDEIPSHTHSLEIYWGDWGESNPAHNVGNQNLNRFPIQPTTGATGGGQAHTHEQNLPPYYTVYVWYRTA